MSTVRRAGGEPIREQRRAACWCWRAFAAAGLVITVAGCSVVGPILWPYPEQPRPAPPPERTASRTPPPQPAPETPAWSDREGLGKGPLGRAGVLLERAIAAAEQASARGAPVDSAVVTHLRMTRSARDLMATGELERAADLLERAIAIDDGEGFGYLYLGYLHLTAGSSEQAGVFLDRAASLLPPDGALEVEVDALRRSARAGIGPPSQLR